MVLSENRMIWAFTAAENPIAITHRSRATEPPTLLGIVKNMGWSSRACSWLEGELQFSPHMRKACIMIPTLFFHSKGIVAEEDGNCSPLYVKEQCKTDLLDE